MHEQNSTLDWFLNRIQYMSYYYVENLLSYFKVLTNNKVNIKKFKPIKLLDFHCYQQYDELYNEIISEFNKLDQTKKSSYTTCVENRIGELRQNKFYELPQQIKIKDNHIQFTVCSGNGLSQLKNFLEAENLCPTIVKVTFFAENPEFGLDIIKTMTYEPNDFYKYSPRKPSDL